MAQNSARNLLTSVDNLFTTQAERDEAQCERVITIPTEQISSFPGHPFHVHIDDKMWEMVDSVKQHGILVPTLVRPKPDGGYQMVAGHRRKLASELAGVPLPCIVRDLTDDEATIIMVDSNLQRENILPSEKAFAYKMKLDAMKRQGVRTDLTSCPVGAKFRSDEELASNSPDSARQIQRYVRLTYLLPELLTMVDNSVLKEKDTKQIAMRPAVELSYLSESEQRTLPSSLPRVLWTRRIPPCGNISRSGLICWVPSVCPMIPSRVQPEQKSPPTLSSYRSGTAWWISSLTGSI